MRDHTLTPAALAALLISSTLFCAAPAAELSSRESVRQALSDQDAWLAKQKHGEGWNAYLRTSDLKKEVSADDADPATVDKILAQYEAREYGLRAPQFVATRKALDAWDQDLHQPKLGDLSAVARGAKGEYRPVSKADVLAREVAAEAAVRRLDRYLARSGKNGTDWRAHLELKELQAEVAKGLEANPDVLRQYAQKYVSGDTGLELRTFSDVGTTVRSYADLLTAYQQSDFRADYDKQIDALAEQLDAAAKSPGNFDRLRLGPAVAELAGTGEAPTLVAAVRRQFAQPNLLVAASKDVVAGGVNDDLQEKTPITDVILGTQVNGSGDTTGHVSLELIPSIDRARMELILRGRTLAHTVGHNGPVTIFSHSTTSLLGRKQLTIDQTAFRGEPACAECSTSSNIDCLNINAGRLISNIATRRVYSNKSTAEAIAAQHAQTRLEGRMDSRSADLLARANNGFNEQFRNPLLRRGAFPKQLDFRTTRDWLTIVGLQARDDELGAGTEPPEVADGTDLSVRLHESLIDNYTAATVSGKTERSLAYRRSMRDLLGEPYDRREFNDFVACMAEAGAPPDKRDSSLLIPRSNFEMLMKDRNGLDVKKNDYEALGKALSNATLTQAQYDTFLAGLSKDPPSYDALVKMLKEGIEVNYSATTFADEHPVEAHCQDGTFRLVMRLKSTTQPKLDSEGHRVVNPYPAEISVTYQLSQSGGQVTAKRVEGQYGVKPLPMPEGAEAKLSSMDQRRRSTILTKTLPRRFFGTGEAAAADEEEGEPIFPPTKSSTGLTLRGRWSKLGELPWVQAATKDGWMVLGWRIAGGRTAANEAADSDTIAAEDRPIRLPVILEALLY
jgi:hypothetical protein